MQAIQDLIRHDQVKIAIQRAGGQTMAASTLRVSATTIQNWIKAGRVPNIDKATALAKLSGIRVQQLRGTL